MSDGSAFVRVASLAQLPDGTLLGVTGPEGERVCLPAAAARSAPSATSARTRVSALSAGELLPDGRSNACGTARASTARSGEPTRGPADSPLQRYEVRVENGGVLLGPTCR